ncbi:alkaline phosphatase family protein [Occultella glacieicola]|uniref:Alkaline phosphatase family protein n=1 Tax=Occultella glacieicola TaxID=2518684 RepID=A0ABY2DYQ9_9MICO|nr:nucleotide pyrophosphatase/phosphodiesterase family protein [Occultella glacieicola]TDE88934.1 alkaline phosphatase family protein [Occultella glacieicola]
MSGPADLAAGDPAGTLGQVLWGAVGACGIDIPVPDGAATSSVDVAAALGLPQARKAVVVLVDGLGWYNLTERAEAAPFLTSAGRLDTLTCAFPSTTATNLGFLGTGRPGGATGLLGYTVRDLRGRLMNMISWNTGADPRDWQRSATVFERLEEAGRVAVSVGPWRFASSPLTTAALRGSEFLPAETLPERIDSALGALREPDVDLVYLYWGDVDSTGHHEGWRSPEWAQALAHTDTEIARLARLLPPGTTLLVTADHGMVDIPRGRSTQGPGPARLDMAERPDLAAGVDLVAGEPRAVHLYCRPGAAETVRGTWTAVLGDRARVLTRAEVIDAGMLGPVDPRFTEVIGDVVVAALGDLAVHDSRTQTRASLTLIGMHGSLTPAERTVPLLVLEG